MYCPQGVKIVVVGNKVDLEADSRAVTTEEGQAFAEESKYAFFETSAKMNVKVEEAFKSLVTSIVQANFRDVPQRPVEAKAETVKISQTQQSQQQQGEKEKCC